MIGLLQRVTQAEVRVDELPVASIGRGILVLVAAERGDDAARAERLAQRLVGYRVFADTSGRMNASVADVGGEVLLVPQFTLAADTRKGARPSFTPAADPADARRLFDALVQAVRAQGVVTRTGRFGADMQVGLTNDGPVTFHLRVPPPA